MANKDEIRYTISVDTESGTASVRNLKGQIVATQVPVKQLRNEFGNFAKTVNSANFNKFNKELKQTNATIGALGNSMSGASAASGSASASVLEVGRAISDSNYGIQGMANNLSQLASNLVYTTKTAGGLGKGLKALKSAFLGPLGLIVIVQTVIMLFERMAMQSSKTESELDKLSQATAKGASNLTILKKAINDGTISQDELSRSLEKANSEYEGLNLKVDENNKLTEDSVLAIDRKIEAMRKLSKAVALQALIEEQYAKLLPLQAEQDELTVKALEAEDRAVKALSQSYKDNGTSSIQASADRARSAVNANKKAQEEVEAQIQRLVDLANKEDLFDEMFKPKKSGKKVRDRANKTFKEQVLDLQKFILQQQRDAELETEMSAERRLRIELEYSKADLLLQKTTFVDKQKLRFKQYTEAEAKRQEMSVEEFKKTQQYANEKAKLQQSIDDAEISHQEAHNALILLNEQKMFSARLNALTDFNNRIDKLNLSIAKNTQKFNKSSLGGVPAGSVGRPMSNVGAESVDTQVSEGEDYNELLRSQFEDDIARKELELRAKFDSEMQVQAELSKMRYNFNLEEMNREIELEQMKIDAKKNINQEYVSWVGGLGNLMRNLAGENEDIAKLALVLEKGAEIADIVIKTQSANAQVSAIASVRATAGDVTAIPEAKTRILKNNIGSGIAIASILATTLKSQKKPSGSGSAGASATGGGGRTFDFNLVGSTGENQLAQGIAGQLGNPVQAYVVSSQMTSQQQLDNAIQTSATIGD